MASIIKGTKKDGSEFYRVQFRKKNKKTNKIESFCFRTSTLEEAHKKIKEWEPIFYFKGKEAIPIDRDFERGKRRFGEIS